MMSTKPRKTSKGKAKIPIKLMTNKNSLYVSFSKRKQGLFKKAASLCSTGVETAVIVFSPAGKPYSFGHPNPDAVIERFLGKHGICNTEQQKNKEDKKDLFWWDNVNVDELSLEQLVELESSLEEVKNMAFERVLDNYASFEATLFDVIN